MSQTNTNLYEETVNYLRMKLGATLDDIMDIWFTDDADQVFMVSIPQFIHVATLTNYDNGFGTQEIAPKIFIKGSVKPSSDFIMFRTEYDGAEAWDHIIIPRLPFEEMHIKDLKTLKDDMNALDNFRNDNIHVPEKRQMVLTRYRHEE